MKNPSPSRLERALNSVFRTYEIASEFFWGFRRFEKLSNVVSVFGSARIGPDHPSYTFAEDLGRRLAQAGYTVLTGGGPGLMEAANRGAKNSGFETYGCGIVLPHEPRPNPNVSWVVTMRHFFTRKYMLVYYSSAFVVLPGGYGTLDEFFEILTLVQTGKIPRCPIFLVGREYWKGLTDWCEGTLIREKTITPDSLTYFTVTDDPEEILRGLKPTKKA